jgi:hypothetical protein
MSRLKRKRANSSAVNSSEDIQDEDWSLPRYRLALLSVAEMQLMSA